jgi:glutamate--cysteine ligase
VAALFDTAFDSSAYSTSLQQQAAKVADPELTPSARILREMHDRDLPFFRLARAYSEQWASHFREQTLAPDVQAAFEQEAKRSVAAQADIEQSDDISFEQYLQRFFAQYQAL